MMNGGKLVTYRFLILALTLSVQVGSYGIVVAAACRTLDSGLEQGAEASLPWSVSALAPAGTNYYIDSVNGSDSNPGTSEYKPWRTLAPVHAKRLLPGDVIHFKRGSSWTGGLVINDSGVKGNPITFTAYGTGDRPVIRNPGSPSNWTHAVRIRADWIVVEGLAVRDAQYVGVLIERGSEHNIVQNIEVTNVGTGIVVSGQHNLVTRNYIHDLHMVRNTPEPGGDFGATGIEFHNSYNEASYNAVINCSAPSYDYGEDGGAVELFGNADGNLIHHNWATGSAGFLEVGGGSARDNIVAYNVSVNNGRFSWIHLSGEWASKVLNFRVENNTIIENYGWVVLGFRGSPTKDIFLVRNNIFYVDGLQYISNASNFTHDHNLYYLRGGTRLGFTLGQGEQIADPLFVDLAGRDFHLQPGSPAIDAGVDLGHTRDFEDRPVPAGAVPDLGAFEYQGMPAHVLIIDDTDAGFSISSSQDAWQEYTAVGGQHYGGTHRYNRQIGTGEDMATWSFTVPISGTYNVYAWWWEGNWRPIDVPYTVNHPGGSTKVVVRVNQQANGGRWNFLGTFHFRDQGSVVVSDDASSGRDVVADAIRLVHMPFFNYLPVVAYNARR